MAETAADIKVSMDALRDYIDRLYFTATFNAKTVGMLASNPGFPIWAKNNTQSTKAALGQYMDVTNKPPHSYVSGDSGAPAWVGAARDEVAKSGFTLGLEDRRPGDSDYDEPGGVATRDYSTTDLVYRFTKGVMSYVAGRDASGNIFLAYGCYGWVPITLNGLPTTSSRALIFRIDPYDDKIGYLVVHDADNAYIYRNTNLRNSASVWVLQRTESEVISQLRVGKYQSQGFLIYSTVGTKVMHSHNSGSTWTQSDLGSPGYGSPAVDIVLGAHSDKVYAEQDNGNGPAKHNHWRSTDHGHTWTNRLQHGSNLSGYLWMPEEDNVNDDKVYYRQALQWEYTTDGFGSTSTPTVTPSEAMQVSKLESDNAVWGGSDRLTKTADAFGTSSYTTFTNDPETRELISEAAINGWWVFATDARKVYITKDWVNVTEVTGNLGSLLGSGQLESVTHYWTDPVDTDDVDLYFGPTLALEDVNASASAVTASIQKTVAANNFYRSLDYPPRHAFALGRMFYGARGDATKRGYFEDAETETGFLKDIYHLLYGSLTAAYPDDFITDFDTWKDTQITMSGDGTTSVPNGLDSGGAYFYPHESKLRGKVVGLIPGINLWPSILRHTYWGQMLHAVHSLRKYRDPFRRIGALGGLTPKTIGDAAKSAVIANVGFPGATDLFAGTPWSDTGSSFVTAMYSVLMTLLGYGSGLPSFRTAADDAITFLRKAVWGISPNNNSQKGYVEHDSSKVEWTRPDHTGGILTAWKRDSSDGKFYFVLGKSIGQLAAGVVLHPNLSGLYQTAQDPIAIPTNMEGSVLAWLAMRIYLAYKYNDDYPDATWANGLDILSGFLSGNVVKDSDGLPIQDADVILVQGAQTANPQDLTSYTAKTTTDADGAYSLPFGVSGDHTVYVVKSGYKHMLKTYNIGAVDQNLTFPDARMVTV